jgi:hypothetical protein
MTKRLDGLEDALNRVDQRYDGDHDCSPDYPTVNWADFQLSYVLRALIEHIDILEKKVAELEGKLP